MNLKAKSIVLSIIFVLSGTSGWAAKPPSQERPEEQLWRNLSAAAQKNFASQQTARLMNRFLDKYPSHPKSINVKYMYSERAFRQKDYKGAAAGYEKFLSQYPKHKLADSAAYRLGEAYYNLKAFNSALTAWQRAASDYPRSSLRPAALENVGLLQMRMGEWGKADETFKTLASNYPRYGEEGAVRESRGIINYFLQDYSEAVQILHGMNRGRGSFFRGLSLFSLKLYDDAVDALKDISASKTSPYRETAAFLKAEGFFQKKNYTLADGEFALFIKKFPRSDLVPYAELRRAVCSLATAEWEEALTAVNRARKRKLNYDARIYGHFIKGAAYTQRRQFSQAVAEFSEVEKTKEFPHLAAASMVRKAWAYRNLGNWSAFDVTLKRMEERFPASPEMQMARFLQGARMFEREKWEDAGARFESAAVEFPYGTLSESALALMTIAYTQGNRLDQLVTSANSALKLFEENYSAQSVFWRAQTYFFIGKAYYELERFKESIPLFEKVVDRHADHELAPRSQLMLGWALLETGDERKAREKALSLLENKKTAKFLKENAEFLMAVSYFNEKDYDKALTELDKFVKKNKNHERAPQARYLMGLSFHQKKKFGSAITEWQKTIKEYPNHPLAQDAYIHIGDLYFKSGEYKKAANFLKEFRQKWPNSPYAERVMWQELQAYFNDKEDETAIGAYPTYIKQFPDSENMESARSQLEMVYYRRGAHGDPKKLEEFLSKYPDSPFAPAARYKLGDMALEQKAWTRAAQEMEQFVRDYPADKMAPDAMYGLGIAYENAGQPEKAIIQYQALLDSRKAKGNAVDAAFRLGALHFKAERYGEAAEAFEMGLKKRPNKTLKANFYYNLAISHENMGNMAESAKAYWNFSKVTADKDQKREALLTGGLLLKKAEDYRGSAKFFKELLKDPGSGEQELQVVNLLAESYKEAGKTSSAMKTYEALVGLEPVGADLRLAGLAQLAYMYEQKKSYPKAVRIYEKISVSGGKKEWVKAAKERVDALQELIEAVP